MARSEVMVANSQLYLLWIVQPALDIFDLDFNNYRLRSCQTHRYFFKFIIQKDIIDRKHDNQSGASWLLQVCGIPP